MLLETHNVIDILNRPPVITDFGRIADPEGFSRRHEGFDDPFRKTDVPIRYSGEAPKLDEVPPNFLPVLHQAMDIHDREQGGGSSCMLSFNQGTLEPGRNFRVIEPHVDMLIHAFPNNPAALEDSFIISDALPTIFYRQGFQVEAQGFPVDIYPQLSETFKKQAKPECMFIPEPYHLIRFSAYAPHASQLATKPTDRTFALIRFY